MPSGVHVFFFRGLSTYGEDVAKWSVFNFGPLARHFARAFSERGAEFYPVLGMGAGSLTDVTARARHFVEQHPVWRDPSAHVHFFGHSAGGLIARLLASQLEAKAPGKILSLMTAATPHEGAGLAQVCLDMPERYRGSAAFLRGFGYDVVTRREFFHEFTRESIQSAVASSGPLPSTVRTGSVVCWAPRSEWCLPLRLLYRIPAFRDHEPPSDGFVERDSQPFGEVKAEIPIDHFRQVGLFGGERRFEQMCDVIHEFFTK